MNRIPPTLLSGGLREAAELKRRMARLIQDKPISLGVHYSADETPDSDEPIRFAKEIEAFPPSVKPLVRERQNDSEVGKQIVIFTATLAALGLVKFAWEKFFN